MDGHRDRFPSGVDPHVYIVILNWNGWRDTIECLESLFRLAYTRFSVIVCDNASDDGSLERIKEWARGELEVEAPRSQFLQRLIVPAVRKPIRYVEYGRAQAEAGGNSADGDVPLVLIRTEENRGFGPGINVGLRYALARDDFDYVWLLNNDSVVEPTALGALVGHAEDKPEAGFCGSTILYYHNPTTVQALGGAIYNRWLGLPRHAGEGQPYRLVTDASKVERRLAYICGASMLVKKALLRSVGLLPEDHFLYGEELDWALRAKGRFGLAFAPASVIYHKEGATIGSASRPQHRTRSLLSEYYGLLARIRLTRRYYPYALPTVYLGFVFTILRRVLARRWMHARVAFRVLIDSFRVGQA